MRALVFVLFIAVLVTAWFAAMTIRKWWRERQLERGMWDVRELSDGQGMIVEVFKQGQQPQRIGKAHFRSPDYSQRLEDLRSEAEEALIANNSKRRT